MAATKRPNLFTQVIYGLKSVPVSIRLEKPEYLVFDDLLQMGVMHVCAIPTKTYIPATSHTTPKIMFQNALFGVF